MRSPEVRLPAFESPPLRRRASPPPPPPLKGGASWCFYSFFKRLSQSTIMNIKQLCHSERSEEPDYIAQPRFLASLGMTQLLGFQHGIALGQLL